MRTGSLLSGTVLAVCHQGLGAELTCSNLDPWPCEVAKASSNLIQVSDLKPTGRKRSLPPQDSEEVGSAADNDILREELAKVNRNNYRRIHQVLYTVLIQLIVAGVAAAATTSMRWYLSPKGTEGKWTATWTPRQFLKDGRPAEAGNRTYMPMDIDIYGAAVSSCIRDMQVLSLGSHQNADESIRAFRVVASLTMLWGCIFVQVFISYMVASELSSVVVLKFRRLYDSFEVAVYSADALKLTANGFHRGLPGGFNPEGFADLTNNQMHTICQMPFSNDIFLLAILFIWTLSCVVDLRRALCMLIDFTITMPVASLKDATLIATAEEGEAPDVTIVGIPLGMRAFLTAVIFLPRLVLDFVILCLGCRWLVATSGFDT